MYVFRYRAVANQPDVTITGNSIAHVLSSRFFKTWTFDDTFEIVVDREVVRLRNEDGDHLGVIGWIKEE